MRPQTAAVFSFIDRRSADFRFLWPSKGKGRAEAALYPPVENGTPLSLRFFETFFFSLVRGGGKKEEEEERLKIIF